MSPPVSYRTNVENIPPVQPSKSPVSPVVDAAIGQLPQFGADAGLLTDRVSEWVDVKPAPSEPGDPQRGAPLQERQEYIDLHGQVNECKELILPITRKKELTQKVNNLWISIQKVQALETRGQSLNPWSDQAAKQAILQEANTQYEELNRLAHELVNTPIALSKALEQLKEVETILLPIQDSLAQVDLIDQRMAREFQTALAGRMKSLTSWELIEEKEVDIAAFDGKVNHMLQSLHQISLDIQRRRPPVPRGSRSCSFS